MGSPMEIQHRDTETQRDTEKAKRFPLRDLTRRIMRLPLRSMRSWGRACLSRHTRRACAKSFGCAA